MSVRETMSIETLRRVVLIAPRIAALVAIVTAAVVLVGWAGDYPLLRSVVPGAVEMKANTALGLLVSGLLLLALSWRTVVSTRRWVAAGAVALACLGTATLFEYAFGVNLGIDELMFKDDATAYNVHRGRMSPYTASVFIALASSFLALGWPRVRWLGRAACVVVLTIGVVSALGYVWNAQELVTDKVLPPVAINTALVMIALSLGILIVDVAPDYLRQLEHGNASREGTIVVALVLTFALFAAGSSYTYRTTAHFDASLAKDEQLEHVRSVLLDLERDFTEVLSAQRALLVRDHPELARAYVRAADAAEKQLQTLQVVTMHQREDAAVVSRLDQRARDYLALLAAELDEVGTGKAALDEVLKRSRARDLRKELMALDDPIENRYADAQAMRRADARRLRQYTLASMLLLLGLVAGAGALIVRALRRDMMLTAEVRRHDDLSREILTVLATTRARSQALERTLRLLCELVPGSAAAFYAPAANGDFDRESASDGYGWTSHFTASDPLLIQVIAERGPIMLAEPLPQNASGSAHDSVQAWRTLCPLVYGEGALGVIALRSPRALKRTELSFLRRKAAHIAVTLTNLNHLSDLAGLSEQLGRKNEMLEAQARELERATRLKSEFLATMSHELRTPLNAIIGFADVLRDDLVGPLNDAQREYVGDILGSGEHLLALINDILDLSKIEAGKMELVREPVNVAALLQSSIVIVRERAASRNIKVDLVAEPGLPMLHADARKLKQVCYNLLSNAVKFSNDGGTVLVAAKECLRNDGLWLEVAVSDTGIGISEADQARLFQPFVQADASLTKQYQGTGLGLALVKRLVELHGGRVGLRSTPGLGSTFSFTLPVETNAESTPPQPMFRASTPSVPRPRSGQRVALVVDDVDADADLLRLQLQRCGFEVLRALDADQALDLAREHEPDLITLDILLAGSNGWNVLERLKQDPQLQHIPVAVVSVIADQARGRALGAVAVLQKPLARRELEAVCTALSLPQDAEKARVLVVDDDPMAAQILAAYFESAGCTVLRMSDASAAVEEARRAPPDLVAVDLIMPGMSGADFIAALRAEPKTAHVPIVVVTAKQLSSEDRALLEHDAVAVLEKGNLRRSDLVRHVAPETQEA